MPYLNIERLSIFYLSRNAKSLNAPPIIFLHGAGGNHRHWLYQWQALAKKKFTVYTIDLPGHGKSTGDPFQDLDSYAELIGEFCNKMSVVDPILIGHSMGGAIALLAAARYTLPCRGLFLVGAGSQLPYAQEILKFLHQHNYTELVTKLYGQQSHFLQKQALQELLAIPKETLLLDFMASKNYVLTKEELSKLNIPVHLAVGNKDEVTPLALNIELLNNLPNSQMQVINNGSHMVMLQHPDIITRNILGYCQQLCKDSP